MFGIISAKYTKVLYAYIFKYVNSLSTTIKKNEKEAKQTKKCTINWFMQKQP